jgi:hypothetical protein
MHDPRTMRKRRSGGTERRIFKHHQQKGRRGAEGSTRNSGITIPLRSGTVNEVIPDARLLGR